MTVPAAWMPVAGMQRTIVYWTAGVHEASAPDKSHDTRPHEGRRVRLHRALPQCPQAPFDLGCLSPIRFEKQEALA